jgi:exonuclease SbcC
LHELAVTGRTAKGAISKKTETKVNKTWPEDSSGEEPECSLDQACKDLLDGKMPDSSDAAVGDMQERARGLCIHLEFLAGLASPEEDREQRMKYQVDRLAASMSGEITRKPVHEEAADAEREWLTMYALPKQDFTAFSARIKKALAKIKG